MKSLYGRPDISKIVNLLWFRLAKTYVEIEIDAPDAFQEEVDIVLEC